MQQLLFATTRHRRSLPSSELRVFNRQRVKRRRFAANVRPIEPLQFSQEDLSGPCVRRYMVNGQQEHVVLSTKNEQPCAKQHIHGEIERAVGLFRGEPLDLSFL